MLTMDFHHISVLKNETLTGLNIIPEGVYVDCTLGGAGHSAGIAEKLSETGCLIGIDRDEDALQAAKERLQKYTCQIKLIHSNFKDLATVLATENIGAVDGILFDLGVSSYQLDTEERGFSYMSNAPLDMRMDRSEEGLDAYDIINTYSQQDLERIFRDYGEERWGKRIAEFICAEREKQSIKTTQDLVTVIKKAIPLAVRRKATGHPAKRIFQAVRIEVNGELRILEQAIKDAVRVLKPHGRIAVITFHSLEDRIVKKTLRHLATGCVCPPDLPVCVCGHHPEVRVLGKAILPTREELERNSRSKSAKLRLAEKL